MRFNICYCINDLETIVSDRCGTWCNFRNEKMVIELLPDGQKELNCPWRFSEIIQADYPYFVRLWTS